MIATLKLSNLPLGMTEDELFQLCDEYGEVDHVLCLTHTDPSMAYVFFVERWELEEAAMSMNALRIGGKIIEAEVFAFESPAQAG